MTDQQARDQRARGIVDRLKKDKATPTVIHDTLRLYALDPGELHFTPHLVTAIRDGGLWPELQRHTI